MPRLLSFVFCLAAPLVAGGEGARSPAAQQRSEKHGSAHGPDGKGTSGADAFRTCCAACHGADGKGDGPRAASLRFHPADLTLIANRHGGSFPAEEVYRIVDGRRPVRGHGGPDMPVWGDVLRDPDTGYGEAAVRERIRAVVDYVRTLQVAAKK